MGIFLRPCAALVSLVLSAIVSVAPAELRASDCGNIVEIDNDGSRFFPDWKVRYRIGDVWELFEREYVELAPGIAFTKRAGQFLNVNCNEDGRPVERQEFYPIGLLVKPLMVLQIPDRGDRGEAGQFLNLVLTEYGHLKVIPEQDIQYLISGATYYFADSNTRVFMCRSPGDCPGNAPDRLRDGTVVGGPCTSALCRPSDEIGPVEGYAVGPAIDPPLRVATSAWTEVERVRRQVAREGALALDAAGRAAFCSPFPVKAYSKGGTPAIYENPYRDGSGKDRHVAFLSLCPDRSLGPAEPPLKIVTKETAQAHFDRVFQGSFYRRFGEQSNAITTVLKELVNTRLTSVKPCEESRTSSETFKAGVGVGFKVKAGVVDLGAQANREWANSVQSVLSGKEHMRFSTYLAPEFETADGAGVRDAWLLDLVFKAKCSDSTVVEPSALVIHYPRFPDGKLEISVRETTNTYARINGREVPNYEKNVSSSLLAEGLFFTIRDAKTFYQWKATILETLRSSALSFYVGEFQDEIEQRMVEDFFVHLIMAAAFHYDFRGTEG